MARTIRSTILSMLKDHAGVLVSPGELFAYAQDRRGYTGTQERLLQRAEELVNLRVIESSPRGRAQNNWYRHK